MNLVLKGSETPLASVCLVVGAGAVVDLAIESTGRLMCSELEQDESVKVAKTASVANVFLLVLRCNVVGRS